MNENTKAICRRIQDADGFYVLVVISGDMTIETILSESRLLKLRQSINSALDDARHRARDGD